MAKTGDKYDQFMLLQVTQSAANTLTFSQVSLGMSLFDYAGLIISRIEYYLNRTSIAELVANADQIRVGIVGSDSLTGIATTAPEVYDVMEWDVFVSGTPATADTFPQPWVHDFSTMQGGGLLVPAQNLYIACSSVGSAIAINAFARVYFRVQQLAAADFVELVQRLRVLTT